MDDRKTQHILDALADLFLTSPAVAAQSPTGTACTPAFGRDATAERAAPNPKSETRDPLDGPAPIRLAPKLQPPTRPTRTASPPRQPDAPAPDDDVIASIGTQTADAVRSRRQVPVPLALEAVLLGSLPGLAGAWVTQYAHHLALSRGPVILLRWGRESLDVDLVSAAAGPPASGPQPGAADSPVEIINALLDSWPAGTSDADAQPPARTLLLQVADPEQVAAWGLAACTIVCGAHDSAIADAVRLLAQLPLARAGADQPGPRPRLMVMGSDAPSAEAAFERLAQALAPHGRTVDFAGSRKRMTPVRVQCLASFPASDAHRADLRAYLEELAHHAEPPPAAELPVPAVPDIQIPTPETRNPKSDTRAPTPESRRPAPDLASLLAHAIRGAIPLAARCPTQPEVPILLDEEGRLHLLARAEADPRQALAALLHVRAWARRHVAILALTQRQCTFDTNADPVLHLATDQAPPAVALVNQLGDLLRVHLVQQAPAPGQIWLCTALN